MVMVQLPKMLMKEGRATRLPRNATEGPVSEVAYASIICLF